MSNAGSGPHPSGSGPECQLRPCLYPPPSISRHSRSPNVPSLNLAEPLCGTSDRVYPPGVPRPRRGARGAAPASCAHLLHGVLQRYPYPSILGKGPTDHTRHSVRWTHPMQSCARRPASPICSNLIYERDRAPPPRDSGANRKLVVAIIRRDGSVQML